MIPKVQLVLTYAEEKYHFSSLNAISFLGIYVKICNDIHSAYNYAGTHYLCVENVFELSAITHFHWLFISDALCYSAFRLEAYEIIYLQIYNNKNISILMEVNTFSACCTFNISRKRNDVFHVVEKRVRQKINGNKSSSHQQRWPYLYTDLPITQN